MERLREGLRERRGEKEREGDSIESSRCNESAANLRSGIDMLTSSTSILREETAKRRRAQEWMCSVGFCKQARASASAPRVCEEKAEKIPLNLDLSSAVCTTTGL